MLYPAKPGLAGGGGFRSFLGNANWRFSGAPEAAPSALAVSGADGVEASTTGALTAAPEALADAGAAEGVGFCGGGNHSCSLGLTTGGSFGNGGGFFG